MLQILGIPTNPISCENYLYSEMVTSTIALISTDLVLVIRVWILYHRPQLLLYMLLALVTLEMIAMCVQIFQIALNRNLIVHPRLVVGYFTISQQKEFLHLGGSLLNGCYSSVPPRLLTYYSLPLLAIAVIMFTMTLFKSYSTIRALGYGRAPIISMFLRDGLLWFVTMLACCIMDFVIWSRARSSLARTPVIFTTGLVSVVGTRVLMNIKSAVGSTSSQDSSTRTGTSTLSSGGARRPGRRQESVAWYLRTT
ncbi:hypothetical protein C8F01DRAFT_1377739 [Mycena amicta]|nr:hypothetical protein C8F01DRAFT_1377739 [Mycena amicta]